MATKKVVKKVAKKAAPKGNRADAFKKSVKALIKRLEDVQVLADKAFAKVPLNLKGVRIHLEGTQKLLAGAVKSVHGDGGDNPNDGS